MKYTRREALKGLLSAAAVLAVPSLAKAARLPQPIGKEPLQLGINNRVIESWYHVIRPGVPWIFRRCRFINSSFLVFGGGQLIFEEGCVFDGQHPNAPAALVLAPGATVQIRNTLHMYGPVKAAIAFEPRAVTEGFPITAPVRVSGLIRCDCPQSPGTITCSVAPTLPRHILEDKRSAAAQRLSAAAMDSLPPLLPG